MNPDFRDLSAAFNARGVEFCEVVGEAGSERIVIPHGAATALCLITVSPTRTRDNSSPDT